MITSRGLDTNKVIEVIMIGELVRHDSMPQGQLKFTGSSHQVALYRRDMETILFIRRETTLVI